MTRQVTPLHIRTVSPQSTRARWLKLQLYLGRRVFDRNTTTQALRLGFGTHVKFTGLKIIEQEARTIQFVATHTTIPVPVIRQIIHIEGEQRLYLIMDHARGQPLDRLWQEMPKSTQSKVIDQLRGYIGQLRALTPPTPELVASSTGGQLWEPSRIGLQLFGPFENHEKFHTFLRAGHPLAAFDRPNIEWMRPMHHTHSLQYVSKFTHGDLAPRNIMCKRDGTITCILDWETSGWFPEYWEYTKAHYAPRCDENWVDQIGSITGEYPEQLAGERQAQVHVEPIDLGTIQISALP